MKPNHQPEVAGPALKNCWNSIGVHGDASCDALADHVHCRNCPVYSSAANLLLERDLPAGYQDERSCYFAQEKPQDDSGSVQSVAIFRIGAEWLALPSAVLAEVALLRPVHTLPHRQGGAVLGMTNVRGSLLVCVSLTWLLHLQSTALPADTQLHASGERMLVIQGERGRLVFAVDEMHGMHRFYRHQLQPPPITVTRAAASYTHAALPWRGHIVGCLDAPLLLHALERALA